VNNEGNSKIYESEEEEFFDKNGTLIRLGDELKLPTKDKYFYKDGLIVEEEGKLGLRFVHQDFFIPLDVLLDEFFDKCEIIKKEETI